MANSKTATFGTYSVKRDENNKITITKDGQLCDNTMVTIREIAGQCGFELNPGWNTQQSGAKLIAFLEEKNPQVTAEPVKTKEQKDAENKALEKKIEGISEYAQP